MAIAPRLRAAVDVVEQMGSESYVYLTLGGNKLICRMDAHRQLKIGETISPAVCIRRAHFFDARTGLRVN